MSENTGNQNSGQNNTKDSPLKAENYRLDAELLVRRINERVSKTQKNIKDDAVLMLTPICNEMVAVIAKLLMDYNEVLMDTMKRNTAGSISQLNVATGRLGDIMRDETVKRITESFENLNNALNDNGIEAKTEVKDMNKLIKRCTLIFGVTIFAHLVLVLCMAKVL